jgi:murein DD-endopeptidase MepM/ murein hydrolase activator NlpD
MKMSVRTKRTAVAVAALAAIGAGTAVHADAAGTRPLLKVPFTCQQEWRGTTWSGHNPDRAIDFNQGSGDSDLGKAVKASADGRVTAASNVGSGYGNRIIIDHGNGWSTLYAHPNSINVSVGQNVQDTTTIGTVGKSGGQSSSHLHYEQRADGSPVSIKFGVGTWVPYYATDYYTRTNC